MKKVRMFQCNLCNEIFEEDKFDISSGIETIISCPNECIIGTVYLPDVCNVNEVTKNDSL